MERGEDVDEYGGPTREREREESVCAVDVGVCLCVVCGRSVPDDEGVICRWIHDEIGFGKHVVYSYFLTCIVQNDPSGPSSNS